VLRARGSFEGRAILLVSFTLEEIVSLSDRILVLYEGRIVAELPPTASKEELGIAMTGGKPAAPPTPFPEAA
jgi:simple sugar transport system ATP-binding protein